MPTADRGPFSGVDIADIGDLKLIHKGVKYWTKHQTKGYFDAEKCYSDQMPQAQEAGNEAQEAESRKKRYRVAEIVKLMENNPTIFEVISFFLAVNIADEDSLKVIGLDMGETVIKLMDMIQGGYIWLNESDMPASAEFDRVVTEWRGRNPSVPIYQERVVIKAEPSDALALFLPAVDQEFADIKLSDHGGLVGGYNSGEGAGRMGVDVEEDVQESVAINNQHSEENENTKCPQCPRCVITKKQRKLCGGGAPCGYCTSRGFTLEECQSTVRIAKKRNT